MAGGTDTTRGRAVSDLVLEQYLLEELPAEQAAALAARLEAEPELAARLAALRRSNAEILARYPAEKVALDIQARAGSAPRRANSNRWLVLAAPLVAAAAAAAVLFLMPPGERVDPVGGPAVEVTRDKGVLAPELVILRRDEAGTARLGPGSDVAPGDKLQLGYLAGGAGHGIIGVMDGTGAVAVFHPGGRDDRLDWGGEVLLPNALELEETGGFLRVVFVADDVDVDADALRRALEDAAGSDDPAAAELDLPGRPVVIDVVLPEDGADR